jgi:hypothetical protein
LKTWQGRNDIMSADLLELLNEFAYWYRKLAEKGVLPRALSGINGQGEQFLIRLDGVTLNHQERHKLIHTILKEEQSVCYAYGGVVNAVDGNEAQPTEQLRLIAATDTYFVMGAWEVGLKPSLRFEQTDLWEGDNPEEIPSAWFLTDAIEVSKEEAARYRQIWREMRAQALILQRPQDAVFRKD